MKSGEKGGKREEIDEKIVKWAKIVRMGEGLAMKWMVKSRIYPQPDF